MKARSWSRVAVWLKRATIGWGRSGKRIWIRVIGCCSFNCTFFWASSTNESDDEINFENIISKKTRRRFQRWSRLQIDNVDARCCRRWIAGSRHIWHMGTESMALTGEWFRLWWHIVLGFAFNSKVDFLARVQRIQFGRNSSKNMDFIWKRSGENCIFNVINLINKTKQTSSSRRPWMPGYPRIDAMDHRLWRSHFAIWTCEPINRRKLSNIWSEKWIKLKLSFSQILLFGKISVFNFILFLKPNRPWPM